MRAPPCSSCPLAGAQVGLCAVVIGRALDLCDLISSGDALIIFSTSFFSTPAAFLATFRAKGRRLGADQPRCRPSVPESIRLRKGTRM